MKARIAKLFIAVTIAWSVTALAETAGTHAAKPAATRPEQSKPAYAVVQEVWGKVYHRQVGEKSWSQTLKKGQTLAAGTEINTGLRGKVTLKLHTTAVVDVQSSTVIAISELSRSPGVVKTRIGLRRGTVRAGIVEETMRSDFQIACPAAVLSREGTWGMEMSYNPFTGEFRIGLDTEGLVRAINIVTGRRMAVNPGEYVTSAMQRWGQTASFDRMVSLVDPFGTTKVEKMNYVNNGGGLAAGDPTATAGLARAGTPPKVDPQARVKEQLQQEQQQLANQILTERLRPTPSGTYRYTPGDFGTQIRNGATGTWRLLLKHATKESAKNKRRH